MDAKEILFKNVIIKMSNLLDENQIRSLKNVLTTELFSYEVKLKDESKELPSVNSERNMRLINNFLSCKKIEGLSDKSITSYFNTLKGFLNMFDVDLLKVDVNMIRMYLFKMEQNGNQNVSLNNKRKKLSVFFELLVEEEYILKNPVKKIKMIKEEQKVKNPYNEFEVAKLKDACKSKKQKALLNLLLSTGCRNEEVCKIKLSDVDFNNKQILIYGKGSKQREVFLNDTCIYHLEQYLMGHSNPKTTVGYSKVNKQRARFEHSKL